MRPWCIKATTGHCFIRGIIYTKHTHSHRKKTVTMYTYKVHCFLLDLVIYYLHIMYSQRSDASTKDVGIAYKRRLTNYSIEVKIYLLFSSILIEFWLNFDANSFWNTLLCTIVSTTCTPDIKIYKQACMYSITLSRKVSTYWVLSHQKCRSGSSAVFCPIVSSFLYSTVQLTHCLLNDPI